MPEVNASHSITVERTVNGHTFTFAKFSPRDRAKLLADLRGQRRALLVHNLITTNIAEEAVFAELEQFDDQPHYGGSKFLDHVNSLVGQSDIHERAYLKANPDKNVVDLDAMTLQDGDGLALVSEICNFRLNRSAKGAGSQNPTEPTTTETVGGIGDGDGVTQEDASTDDDEEDPYSLAVCAKINRWFPYLGNPWDLTLDLFEECRSNVSELESWDRGTESTSMGKVLRDQQRYMRKMGR